MAVGIKGRVMVDAVVTRTKAQLRAEILAARQGASAAARKADTAALCAHLPALVVRGDTVCAYVPVGSEPGSVVLLDVLQQLGARVLLPVARWADDGTPQSMQWGEYRPDGLVAGQLQLLEPVQPWLPPSALATAQLILTPALAVDRRGVRLGRGAGFYDRTLGLRDPVARLIAVVRDAELVDELPAEPHDVRMTNALTPGLGVVPLG